MGKTTNYIAALLTLAVASFTAAASSFSTMGIAEVSSLLDAKPAEQTEVGAHTAMVSATVDGLQTMPEAIDVNAHDLITKIYGLVDSHSTRCECVAAVESALAMTPSEEEGDMWLDSKDGYQLRYSGLMPQMSGMARFDGNDAVAEYCYFFLFPYSGELRESVNRDQAEFTGCLLQEMYDMGMPLGVNTMSDDLMEVEGKYLGNDVDVRLLEQAYAPAADDMMANADNQPGRFILMFIVKP